MGLRRSYVLLLAVLLAILVVVVYSMVAGRGSGVDHVIDTGRWQVPGVDGCESPSTVPAYSVASSVETGSSQARGLPKDAAVVVLRDGDVGVLENTTCVIASPEPRYILVYNGVNVALDTGGRDEVETAIALLNGLKHGDAVPEVLKSISSREGYLLLGIHAHSVHSGPLVVVSVNSTRVFENMLGIVLYLAGIGGFEAEVSVQVVEGWLSDYAPSTTPAPTIASRVVGGTVLKACFHGQYRDRSDYGRNLAAWKVTVNDDSRVNVVPFYLLVAGNTTIVLDVSVDDYSFTLKCTIPENSRPNTPRDGVGEE